MKKSKGNKLNKLTREEIENGLEFQSKFGWTFYSERELLENAVTQQVNFVVAAYAIFIAAAAQVGCEVERMYVLGAGTLLQLILLFAIYRVYKRWDLVIRILYHVDEKHVLPMLNKETEYFNWLAKKKTLHIRALWIPIFCVITTSIGFSYYLFRVI